MIGARLAVEATVETVDGPESAAHEVRQAMTASGFVLPVSLAQAHLLPGEDEALRAGRRVLSTVEIEVETLVDFVDVDDLIDHVFDTLRERGSTVTAVSVGRVLHEP